MQDRSGGREETQPATREGHPAPSRFAWVALALVLVLVAIVRWRVIDAPLERDEGEYAYAGRLILDGVPPYAEVYNMKLPGIYAAYAAVLALVPDTAGGIHGALLAINAATMSLLFLIGRRVGAGLGSGGAGDVRARADLVGVLAAAAYGVLTLGKDIQGLFANAEHFVVLPATLGVLLLLRALERGRLVALAASGLCFGLAFLVKQHGAAFGLFGFLWLAVRLARGAFVGRRVAALLVFVGSGLLPLLVTVATLAAIGIFDAFWWWTFEYARDYVGQVGLAEAAVNLRIHGLRVVGGAPLVWGAAAVGLTALLWDRRTKGARVFLALLAVLSFVAVCPGFFFRQHYFVLMTPAVALLAAVALAGLGRAIPGPTAIVAATLATVCLGQSVAAQGTYLFALTPRDVTRHTFPLNPFAESKEVARIVAAYSKPGDRIAIFGSEPQIGFYARRRLATGFIYMYPLTEAHAYAEELQRKLVEEYRRNDPEIVVFVTVWSSWLGAPNRYPVLREWMQSLEQDYVALARIPIDASGLGLPIPPEATRQLFVDVYKKKP